MSQLEELKDDDLVSRNDLFQRVYLDSIIKEADKQYGVSDEIKEKWLEYADSGYNQSRRSTR
jgi:hypothetical protein